MSNTIDRNYPAFHSHAERVLYTIVSHEVGNAFFVEEDATYWKANATGSGTAKWTSLQRKTLVIPFDHSWYEIDATALAAFSGGASNTPGIACDGSEGAGIRWNNAAAPDPIARSIPVPLDLDPAFDIDGTVVCWKTGAPVGDATTFDVGVFFNTVGALYDADANAGETSSAITGDATSKTVQASTFTVDSADIPDPQTALTQMTITIQPTDGLLGTDDITVGCLVLEYNATHVG